MSLELITTSNKETIEVGNKLGSRLRGGEVITLSGPLGAGKTTFVKGVGKGLDISPELITSPTFILRAEHQGRLHLAHIDLFRLDSPKEIQNLGLFEQEDSVTVLVIEWPEKALFHLPQVRMQIEISPEGEFKRKISMTGIGNDFPYLIQEIT